MSYVSEFSLEIIATASIKIEVVLNLKAEVLVMIKAIGFMVGAALMGRKVSSINREWIYIHN